MLAIYVRCHFAQHAFTAVDVWQLCRPGPAASQCAWPLPPGRLSPLSDDSWAVASASRGNPPPRWCHLNARTSVRSLSVDKESASIAVARYAALVNILARRELRREESWKQEFKFRMA